MIPNLFYNTTVNSAFHKKDSPVYERKQSEGTATPSPATLLTGTAQSRDWESFSPSILANKNN